MNKQRCVCVLPRIAQAMLAAVAAGTPPAGLDDPLTAEEAQQQQPLIAAQLHMCVTCCRAHGA